jgi:hypothetical protein
MKNRVIVPDIITKYKVVPFILVAHLTVSFQSFVLRGFSFFIALIVQIQEPFSLSLFYKFILCILVSRFHGLACFLNPCRDDGI